MEFFESQFYQDSLKINDLFRTTYKLIPTRFPEFKIITSGDAYWQNLWRMIDEAKSYIWVITYTMDCSVSANYTLKKLIEASRRGVKVVLYLDDLNYAIDKKLSKELEDNGGTVVSLNPIAPYFLEMKFSTYKDMFARHHEKLSVSDDRAIVGSSNIADDYSGPLYGSNDFLDLNAVMKNQCLSEIRQLFKDTADQYNIKLDKKLSNEEIVAKYDQDYPDSNFNIPQVKLLRSKQPYKRDINQFVLNHIEQAKKKILIVQPYYFPIKRVDTALIDALERGVEIEMYTAAKRDPPALKPVHNFILMQKLIKKGLKVFEISDKFLHMKIYHFDDEIYTMGSFNNDKLSWRVNHECNIVVEGPEEVAKMKQVINDVKVNSLPVDPHIRVGFYRMMKRLFWEGFMRSGHWFTNKKKAIMAEMKLRKHNEILKEAQEQAEQNKSKSKDL